MDIADFTGITKYKYCMPMLYLASFIGMIFGPVFFESIYRRFCLLILIFSLYKLISITGVLMIVLYRSTKIIRKHQRQNQQPLLLACSSDNPAMNLTDDFRYVFVIPSYKEEIEVLSQTLDVLASHTRATKQYMIFMAMEGHEQGCEAKATELINTYREKFRCMEYTVHQIQEFEQKGKASNVSWCVQHMEPFFEKHGVNPESVYLTIMDADSWAPNMYIDEIESRLATNYLKRHLLMFQPPQIYTRNHMEIPMLTRVQDMTTSIAQASNSYSCIDLTFPLSNYTVSYNLIKRIGFWDTCADAIGEDFHTMQKAYWKTRGQVIGVPICVPFNQLSIETGEGYISNLKARFWQAERHAQGVADVAYNINQFLKNPFRWKNLVILYDILELFGLPALLPWVYCSTFLQSQILYGRDQEYEFKALEGHIYLAITVVTIIGYTFYEIFKRRANTILYGHKNENILHMLEYIICLPVIIYLIAVPTFTIANWTILDSKREYRVAEKKMNAEQAN